MIAAISANVETETFMQYHPSNDSWISYRIPSAELALKMHLREPEYREYEGTNAQPEHDDHQLAKPKFPVSVSKVRGNGYHQVNVSNDR
jgi:hypothetical protein